MRAWLDTAVTFLEASVEEEADKNARNHYGPTPETFMADSLANFRKMTASADCEVLWQALERRADPNASQHAPPPPGDEVARRYLAGEEIQPKPLPAVCLEVEIHRREKSPANRQHRYLPAMAWTLAMAATEILQEPLPTETSGARRKRLKKIEAAASEFCRAFQPLWETRGTLIKQFYFGENSLRRYAEEATESELGLFSTVEYISVSQEDAAVMTCGAIAALRNPTALIRAMVGEAREWSEQPPEIARPNDPNATRLFFIRQITRYFREAYGEPLRACTLALTQVFFESDSLDEAAITKIAP